MGTSSFRGTVSTRMGNAMEGINIILGTLRLVYLKAMKYVFVYSVRIRFTTFSRQFGRYEGNISVLSAWRGRRWDHYEPSNYSLL